MTEKTPSSNIPSLDIPVIAFVAASSGTGKTTLMESVLTVLVSRGYRIGTVKHSAHTVQMDKEGSDSWRFSKAGAVNSVVVDRITVAVMRSGGEVSVAMAILDAGRDVDIVLVEGFKELDLPKIELYREGHTRQLLSAAGESEIVGIIAVAAEGKVDVSVPVLPLNRPEVVCDFIEERFLTAT
jgi:molybdopterin-guanine dinucleotide biosynthesis protein MobB